MLNVVRVIHICGGWVVVDIISLAFTHSQSGEDQTKYQLYVA